MSSRVSCAINTGWISGGPANSPCAPVHSPRTIAPMLFAGCATALSRSFLPVAAPQLLRSAARKISGSGLMTSSSRRKTALVSLQPPRPRAARHQSGTPDLAHHIRWRCLKSTAHGEAPGPALWLFRLIDFDAHPLCSTSISSKTLRAKQTWQGRSGRQSRRSVPLSHKPQP